jgi:hypothetical protein
MLKIFFFVVLDLFGKRDRKSPVKIILNSVLWRNRIYFIIFDSLFAEQASKKSFSNFFYFVSFSFFKQEN